MARNSDYWEQRFEALEKANNGLGRSAYDKMEKVFIRAQRQLQADIDSWLARLAVNNEVSLQEAKRLLTADELKEFKWTLKEYIEHGKESGINQKWLKELENASAKYHINRLQMLQIKIRNLFEDAYTVNLKTMTDLSTDVYNNSYYHAAFEVQKGIGVGWQIAGADEKKLNKLLVTPWAADGRNFSDRTWRNKATMVYELQNELTRQCLLGKSSREAIEHMSRFVDKKFKNAKAQASRLVYTEQAFFASAGAQDSFNELGVEKYIIVATLDSHTSEICQDMDGRVFDMKDYSPGSTAPPFHVRCRSVTAPYFDDEFAAGSRAARGKDGKTYQVPNDMTYREWKALQSGKTLHKQDDGGIIDLYRGRGIDVLPHSEISTETLKQVSKATKKVTSDFKILEKYSEPIKFGNVNGGWAVNNYDPRTGLNQITLHKIGFSNPEQLLGFLKEDFLTGKSYQTNSISSLVAHEMGHNAHIALALKRSGLEYGKPLSELEIAVFDKNYNKILKDIYEVAFTYESEDEIFSQCAQGLGSMAIKPRELIAQAFGNYYYGSGKSRIAKKIVKYFKKELK